MKLSKPFTALAIGSVKRPSRVEIQRSSFPQLQKISRQLWLSYAGAMLIVLCVSTASIYQFVSYRIHDESDQVLTNLATAASHNLGAIETNSTALNQQLPNAPDNDGDLDLPWQNLKNSNQSIEWFDSLGNRLASSGATLPTMPLLQAKMQGWEEAQSLRILTLPIYTATSHHQPQIQGYVRVSESIISIQKDLKYLLAGLTFGNAIALLLIAITGRWLTHRSMQSIEQGIDRLQQFTADASHELRSPITAIKTAIEVMQSHPERVHLADRKKLDIVSNATQQMTQLVEDLLALSRFDAAVVPSQILLPINDILEDLIESRQGQAANKSIELNYQAAQDIFVQGDGMQLYRLFSNLIDNALQYTPTGGTVTVQLLLLGSRVEILVEDTGIGISEQQIAKVFDRFWRADQARSRRGNGAGLGLSIAQAIAQSHNGKISVTSQVGVGSCFRVRLPRIS